MFKNILEELSKGQRLWVVECVFGNEMYSTLSTHNTQEEAEEVAKSLSYKCGHEFLTYRARPMKYFRKFNDDSTTIFTTTNKDMDKVYETKLKQQRDLKLASDEKNQAIKSYIESSCEPSTPEHFIKNLYLMYMCSKEISECESRVSEQREKFKEYYSKLEIQTSNDSQIDDKFKLYLSEFCKATGENLESELLNYWELCHKELPLPSKEK